MKKFIVFIIFLKRRKNTTFPQAFPLVSGSESTGQCITTKGCSVIEPVLNVDGPFMFLAVCVNILNSRLKSASTPARFVPYCTSLLVVHVDTDQPSLLIVHYSTHPIHYYTPPKVLRICWLQQPRTSKCIHF